MKSDPAASSASSEFRDKCLKIEQALAPFDKVGVAYSGGVDSTFVCWFLKEELGKSVVALFVDTPFISAREREDALRTAAHLGLDLEVLAFDPLDSGPVRENPFDRCYFCKKEVFKRILDRAGQLGCQAVADGSHAGDASGWRPGKKALAELRILSPLAIAGLSKDEIRQLSRAAGIPNWNKPSQSCLATRIPYGTAISREVLDRIEKAEDLLHEMGCVQVRVRVHGDLARIEAQEADFAMLVEPENRAKIIKEFNALGFAHVSLDLAGFRSGSWDKQLL